LSKYFNDSPIEREEDDQYGIAPFARVIATSLLKIEDPIGSTIAVNGPWGSGKSSAVNLIRSELDRLNDPALKVVDFRCWWYRGEEALALAFLQKLNSELEETVGNKVKGLVPELGRHLLQAGPVIGTAVSLATTGGVGELVSGSAAFVKRFFSDKDSLETTFLQLSKALRDQDKRLLVIVDDIDRLSPDEALAIFRLVKSVGRLPNVMYLLVFDRDLAEKAVAARYPSEGPHFLEKIIQASFELPTPSPTDLNDAILGSFEKICGAPPEQHIVRFMNLFYDIVVPYLTTPRHVARLINAISVTWPPMAESVSRADFLALETLRLYEPGLFRTIRANRECVTGSGNRLHRDKRDGSRFEPFLRGAPDEHQTQLKLILQRLFPAMEDTTYGEGFDRIWDAERRVCVGKNFDTYFRLSLSEETISNAELGELIARAGDKAFIQERFRAAAVQVRKSGKSMVPVLLDELNSHARDVARENVEPLVSAIFEIADEICLPEDDERGFMTGSTRLRFHWLIRRLTEDRFTLEERSAMYVAATANASTGWLVDFTSSAVDDYRPKEGESVNIDQCLVLEAVLPELKARSLQKLHNAAQSGELIQMRDLIYNLYRWHDFSTNEGSEVKGWLAEQMKDDAVLVTLAKAFTGESWSTGLGGFGGLGDRVSKRNVRAQITDDTPLLDAAAFRAQLERIVTERKLKEDDLVAVETLLNAWDDRRRG
jgi:predicted KAP-like P-loop ATPase